MGIIDTITGKLRNQYKKNGKNFDLHSNIARSFIYSTGAPAWTGRDYVQFANEDYIKKCCSL